MGDVPKVGPRFRVGVVGATGAVGSTVLNILRERNFPVGELRLFASPNSRGRWLETPYGDLLVEQLVKRRIPEFDVVFMSAGSVVARTWARRFARKGAVVIDKSPYFRQHADVPLVIPEVNERNIRNHHKIVACPNCSTVPVAMTLAPLCHRFGLRYANVVTFQSVSGAGKNGVATLSEELADCSRLPSAFPQRIAYNVIPWIGKGDGASSGEEAKMIAELRRILELPRLSVSATCVRVPSMIGHAMAVSAEFKKRVGVSEAKDILSQSDGIKVVEGLDNLPTPLVAAGRDEVFVGRIRRDRGPNCLSFFAATDNLRKGAATNGVQIAELMIDRGLIIPSA